jgi:hypothetical protein
VSGTDYDEPNREEVATVFFFLRDELEREIGKDKANLAAKCPAENALRANMPDCESRSLRDFILSKRAAQLLFLLNIQFCENQNSKP